MWVSGLQNCNPKGWTKFSAQGRNLGTELSLPLFMSKVALSIHEGRIAPVFEESRHIVIYDLEMSRDRGLLEKNLPISILEKSSSVPNSGEPSFLEKASLLSKAGVDCLICGAISRQAYYVTEAFGLKIYSFIAGSVFEIIEAWIQGRIDDEELKMPGYRRCRRPMMSCRSQQQQGCRGPR